MPVMDGFQALQEMRRLERECARQPAVVLACSAKALTEDVQACLTAGFDGYLSKPMRRQELLDTVRKATVDRGHASEDELHGPTFLVADGSDVMRIIIAKVLKELGQTRILEAGNGQEALELFKNNSVDCIICDWNMQRMKGIELLHEVRATESSKGVPFIMLTAEHLDDCASRAMDTGSTRFLTKPFHLEELKAAVASVLPELPELSKLPEQSKLPESRG